MADIPGQDTGPDRAPETTAAPDAADKPKPRLGSLRALWPFVLRHKGLLVAWLVSLAASSTATLSLPLVVRRMIDHRSEEHTSELQSLMRNSYAVFCLKKKN